MSPSKLSEKYWKGGATFGTCVSQKSCRGKNDRFRKSVSQLYSKEIFSEDASVFESVCSSKQQEVNLAEHEKIKRSMKQCTYERFFYDS